jgi:hypothetical protein
MFCQEFGKTAFQLKNPNGVILNEVNIYKPVKHGVSIKFVTGEPSETETSFDTEPFAGSCKVSLHDCEIFGSGDTGIVIMG